MTGLDLLGADETEVGLALWTAREEAKAGIRAARTLQQLYADVLKQHPDAVKYEPQVKPIIKDADEWDAAWVFYQNSEAVEIGRRAQTLVQQIAAEYKRPPVQSDPALGPGFAEHLQESGKKTLDTTTDTLASVKKYLPWIVGGVVVVGVGAVAAPLVGPLLARSALARRRS